jgi:adenine-specific DNA-methyltransferase
VWDDVPFQGIAKRGGRRLLAQQEAGALIERVLACDATPGDWVLDPFLGSGTTAAVAHKMGRRWVGIEQGDVLQSLALPRLERVISGTDRTGITKVRAHGGGGGFALYSWS